MGLVGGWDGVVPCGQVGNGGWFMGWYLMAGVMKALTVCGFYTLEGPGVILGVFGIHPWKREHGV